MDIKDLKLKEPMFHSFNVGDFVTNGYKKFEVIDIDKENHLYFVKNCKTGTKNEFREYNIRFWKEPKFSEGDSVEIIQSGDIFNVEGVKLDNFMWYYGWNNPSDMFYERQWVAECNLKLDSKNDMESKIKSDISKRIRKWLEVHRADENNTMFYLDTQKEELSDKFIEDLCKEIEKQ